MAQGLIFLGAGYEFEGLYFIKTVFWGYLNNSNTNFHFQTVVRLATLYAKPDDIDLTVGLNGEKLVPGALGGPTAVCIFKEQFKRICESDRYFYCHKDGPLTTAQIQQIEKMTLAKLFCTGSKIEEIQAKAFYFPSIM